MDYTIHSTSKDPERDYFIGNTHVIIHDENAVSKEETQNLLKRIARIELNALASAAYSRRQAAG